MSALSALLRRPVLVLAEAPLVYAWGIDYAHGSGLTTATMKANGVQFACRYLSNDPTKNINTTELRNLAAAGIAVVLNWESTGNELGFAAGAADAARAETQAIALGHPEAPIIFSPWDHDPAGHTAGILDYMRGAASVLGAAKVGLYQGYAAVKAALDAKVCRYAWQTYAWSGGAWDPRAQLNQYANSVTMGPAQIDRDRAMAADYGQIPRPPRPVPVPAAQMPGTRQGPDKSGTGFRWVADGTHSLADVALARGATVIGLIAVSVLNLNDPNRVNLERYVKAGVTQPMPPGLVFYTARK
jgi:hypothetical protein